jgi:hypothetical protein
MESFKIKGRITSITPNGRSRLIYKKDCPKDLFDYVQKECQNQIINQTNKYAYIDITINGRLCRGTWTGETGYIPNGSNRDDYSYIYITVKDESKNSTVKPLEPQTSITGWVVPLCNKKADKHRISFYPKIYRTEGLAKTAIKMNGRMYGRVMKPIQISVPCPSDCEDCADKFACFTERD